jgi:CRP/FNR family transcriptional regulator
MREGQSCSSCRLATYCFPPGIDKSHLHLLSELVNQQTILHRNEYIYRAFETFRKIFIIRSGSVKTFKINSNGEKIITGFCYPGEILGFDAIATKTYQENALALDTVSVCELNFNELEKLSSKFPSYQHQLVKLMSEKLSSNFFLNLSSSAESKIAFFLLTISNKMKNYGTTGMNFNLSMTREDIARYLGLATETVSRILSKFQLNNILECSKKNIFLKDYSQLQILASQAG